FDAAPTGTVCYGDGLGKNVVFHHLGGLLITRAGIGGCEHHMLPGRSGQSELTMGMLADLPAFHMADLIERMPPPQRSDPVLAVTEIIAATALHDPIGIGFPPQTLIDTEGHADAGSKLEHVLHRIDP